VSHQACAVHSQPADAPGAARAMTRRAARPVTCRNPPSPLPPGGARGRRSSPASRAGSAGG
jgi:hypothetical protein